MPTPASASHPRKAALWGVGFMLLGCFMFSVNDAMGKWLVGTYSVGQVLLLRSVSALVLLLPFLRRVDIRIVVRPARPGLHVLRAAGSAMETGFFYWALSYLPLANVMTFYLAGPIYVTALSALILKERVGWVRWSAVLVGFGGVLIALGPDLASAGWPALIAVAGSFCYALLMISTRILAGAGETTLITWQTVMALVFGAVLAPMHWVTPSAFDLGFLFLLGIVAMAAHSAVNRSLTLAPASTVVPYQYTLIVWALLFGVVVFDETPRISMLVGAAVITASGVFIFLREQRLKADMTAQGAAGMVGAPDDIQIPPAKS
ncbi:DMT family transporter [Aureimonas sp. Leaf324]|jgi:drug/metabolite transporter (DMT)-like permease|uniref:DMT family transporter n=1 Tax=Aureimonas sp. Leaf324 TaxID=1736336 RepID=UPI0006FFEAFD|nr:DMT family transporter [Aureimonas sp. Leaf324]KQQ85888.1 multidrug DMT transporter permease [Aureimonas sp. Leaf324]